MNVKPLGDADPPSMDAPLFSIRYANDACPLVILPEELLEYWEGSGPLGDPGVIPDFAGTDYERATAAHYLVDVLPVGPGQGLVLGAQTDVCNLRWMLLPNEPGPFVLIPMDCEEEAELHVPGVLAATPDLEWKPVSDSFSITSDRLAMFTSVSPGQELITCHPYYKPGLDDSQFVATLDCIYCPVQPGRYTVEYAELPLDATGPEPGIVVCRFQPHEPSGDGRELMRRALELTGLGQPPAYNVASAFVDLVEQYRLIGAQSTEVAAVIARLQTSLAEAFPQAEAPVLIGAYAHGTVAHADEVIDLLLPAEAIAADDRLRADSSLLIAHVCARLGAALRAHAVRADSASIRLRWDAWALMIVPGLSRPGEGFLVPDGHGGWHAQHPAFPYPLARRLGPPRRWRAQAAHPPDEALEPGQWVPPPWASHCADDRGCRRCTTATGARQAVAGHRALPIASGGP
jgi:hypothetical protein